MFTKIEVKKDLSYVGEDLLGSVPLVGDISPVRNLWFRLGGVIEYQYRLN